MNQFDIMNNLAVGKDATLIDSDPAYAKAYSTFGLNRAFMQNARTIMIAAEANKQAIVDKHFHQDYMIAMIKGSTRAGKWVKKDEKDEFLPFVIKQYRVSERKALEMMTLLTKEQLQLIAQRHSEGGVEKSKGKK